MSDSLLSMAGENLTIRPPQSRDSASSRKVEPRSARAVASLSVWLIGYLSP